MNNAAAVTSLHTASIEELEVSCFLANMLQSKKLPEQHTSIKTLEHDANMEVETTDLVVDRDDTTTNEMPPQLAGLSLPHQIPVDKDAAIVHKMGSDLNVNTVSNVRRSTEKSYVVYHIVACFVCALMWIATGLLFYVAYLYAEPYTLWLKDVTLKTLNGQVSVTCKFGALPLDHLRCILFMRITNWLNWAISGISKYLGGLEEPGDLFCFICTALGGMYMTCAALLKTIGRKTVGITVAVYKHTFCSLDNPMSPFSYMESSLELTRRN